MRAGIIAACIALAFTVAGCNDKEAALPPPLEPDARSVGYYCHMNLAEHQGPKAQAFVRGQDRPYWFASPGEAFVFLQVEALPNSLQAIYVNDMGQGGGDAPAAGAWVEIHTATYVIDRNRSAAMGGPEVMPFADKTKAEAFAQRHGGALLDFEGAAKALAIDAASNGT